ncbi:epimerase [Flavobacterium rivuli WB 3.3-2 = DSM 21788]|uniref:Epimerase n=1 Tax=Flavobacterium rivuli WB 3.3-2 = DSM 21788 TaxID=1121895 RepID=A0A0A2MFC6_9FLAO|nr:SDR family oxidoreductase [Flavobacterium rivuli]KGO87005.1 epimerase [Flavobacterium rivuli WB 3.3-2 = DSM 21788]
MQVSVLGCGWLGLPLAKALLAKGFSVKGSTTTYAKLTLLKDAGIDPYLIDVENYVPDTTAEFLSGSDILIINIPPRVKASEATYADRLSQLLPYIGQEGISKVLFVSSTSVYADDNTLVTEFTLPVPDTESGKQVLEAELLFEEATAFKTTIIRFGGLIGEGRHPVKFLAGKENLANPDAPVNLIHQDDCIGIILKIITADSWGEVYNGVSPHHPSRKAYYTAKASQLNLPLPQFNHSEPSTGKTVSGNKVVEVLGYEYKNLL